MMYKELIQRVRIPLLILALFSPLLGCGSDGDSSQIGEIPTDGPDNSGAVDDVAGSYTAQFFSLAGASAPGIYTFRQDGSQLSLEVSSQTVNETVDGTAMDGATGQLGDSMDGQQLPFSLRNDQVVMTGKFVRQEQAILLEAEVNGIDNARSGRLIGAQPLSPE